MNSLFISQNASGLKNIITSTLHYYGPIYNHGGMTYTNTVLIGLELSDEITWNDNEEIGNRKYKIYI